jgi:hypothetical protein
MRGAPPGRSPMPKEPTEDAMVNELVEGALAGWEALLPPEALARIRGSLMETLRVHPDGRQLLRQLRPDPTVQQSGDVPREGATEAEAEPRVRKAGA